MRTLTSRIVSVALLVSALAAAFPGVAQPRFGSCNLSVFALSFGKYDVFAANRSRSATRILVDCRRPTGPIRPRVELSTGSSQNFARRTQLSGSNVLTYNIYVDPALTQIAGDGSSGTSVLYLDRGPPGPVRHVDLYGAIDPRQFAAPGTYFDTVYVTLIF